MRDLVTHWNFIFQSPKFLAFLAFRGKNPSLFLKQDRKTDEEGERENKKLLNGCILPSIKVRRNKFNNPEDYPRREKPKGKLSCRDWCPTGVGAALHRAGSAHTQEITAVLPLSPAAPRDYSIYEKFHLRNIRLVNLLCKSFYLMYKPTWIHQGKECAPVL